MVELFSLIKGFNSEELQVIKHSFKKNRKDSNIFLLGKLFDVIDAHPEGTPSDMQLSLEIYKKKKDLALGKLKSRLFYHILDVLGSENVLMREEIFNPSDRHELRIRKKMYYFRVLYRKKNNADYNTLIHLLNEVVKDGKEYELYDLILDALRHKMLLLTIRDGFKKVEEVKAQIEHYVFCYDALLKTYGIYYNLMTNIIHVQNASSNQIKQSFISDLKEIEGYVKATGSAFIKYMYNMVRLEEKQRSQKYPECIDICLDQISLIKNKKFLYRDERMGNIYDNISQCHVYMNNFSSALKSVHKAQEYYSENLRSYIVSKEQEFHVLFYSGDYKSSLGIIEHIASVTNDSIGDFAIDRHLFLKSCACFKMSKFRESINICNKALELTKDKGRWDTGVRYIRIMNMIELEEFDLADSSLEALRKSFGRNKNKFISDRDKLIYKLLKEYCNIGFGNKPSKDLVGIIKELSGSNTSLCWQYYSHELFPIQAWISSRLDFTTVKTSALYKQK